MENKPFISIVLILKEFYHLANLTLKSIVDQTENNYEIILLESAETKKDLVMIKPFLEKIKLHEHFNEYDQAQFMNRGLELSNGKYVHFLFSGDVYISRYMIGYLTRIIIDNNFPDLVSCAILRRDEISCPESVSYSYEGLKNGRIPVNIQSCLFLIDTVNNLNKFSTKFEFQVGFDMICKIFVDKTKKIIFSNRVLTDYQLKKRPSVVAIYIGWENVKIIYKNFGFAKTFWWVVHDHFRLLKLLIISIKEAFWNP